MAQKPDLNEIIKNSGILFFFTFYNEIPVVVQGQVSIVITIEIRFAGFGNISVGHILELKSKALKFFLIGFCHFFFIR